MHCRVVTWRFGRGGGDSDTGLAVVCLPLFLGDVFVGLQLLLLLILRQLELVLNELLGGAVVLRVSLARRLLFAEGLHLSLLFLLGYLKLPAD